MGITMKLIMRLKPSILSVKDAIRSPSPESPRDMMIITRIDPRRMDTSMGTLTTKDKSSSITPWIRAVVLIPMAFPMTMAGREMGATSISFKNPNCRSCITESPENTEVKRMVWAMIPGR